MFISIKNINNCVVCRLHFLKIVQQNYIKVFPMHILLALKLKEKVQPKQNRLVIAIKIFMNRFG